MRKKSEVVVVCNACGRMAPTEFDPQTKRVVYLFEGRKCPHCGEEEWVAHDTDRDLRTGRPLPEWEGFE